MCFILISTTKLLSNFPHLKTDLNNNIVLKLITYFVYN